MFRSPTCTPLDEQAARALAKLADVELETYAGEMFEHGGAISGEVKKAHTIDTSKCLKCGACIEKCRFGAISKQ